MGNQQVAFATVPTNAVGVIKSTVALPTPASLTSLLAMVVVLPKEMTTTRDAAVGYIYNPT